MRCGVVDIIRFSRERVIAPLLEPKSIFGRVLSWTEDKVSVFLEGRKVTITSFEQLRIVLALDPHNYLQGQEASQPLKTKLLS